MLGLMVFFAIFTHAQIVSRQQARQKAVSFIREKGLSAKQDVMHVPLSTFLTQEEAPFYVFNAPQGKGFVIVSGDERAEEILGYGMNCQFDENKIPATMKTWLMDYALQIDAVRKGGVQTSPLRVPTHQAVHKLVSAVWGQGDATESGDAFNQQCPKIDGKYCVAGCVAIAMAQVMYYHQWPQANTSLIPGYTSNETVGYLSSLSKIKFDWSHMLDRYDEGQTSQQRKAVAQLIRYCGQAVEMDYGLDASSASSNDVAMAFRTYFGYDTNTRFVLRSDYSAEAWDRLIYKEISEGRPVLYKGNSPSGGHAFVCDGYDGQGYYHINWGWEGYCNGYFKLSILNPHGSGTGGGSADSGYSMKQGAVVGIQKPTGETDEMRTLSLEDFYRDGHIISAQYCNRTGMAGSFTYGFAYQKASETGSTYNVRKTTASFDPLILRTYSLNLDEMTLADDTYRFYPYAIMEGCKWYHVIGDRKKFFEVTISGGQVTNITYHPRAQLVIKAMDCVGNLIEGQSQEVSISIYNGGEEFNNLFYLFVSQNNQKGEPVDKVCLPVEFGATESTSLYFTPNSTGKWNIWIDINEDGSSNISPITVNIKPAPTAKSNLSVVSYDISQTTDPVFKVRIKNNGSQGYYRPINCYIFEDTKTYNIDFSQSSNLNIASKGMADLVFSFESLELGKEYTLRLKDYVDHQTNDTEWLGGRYRFKVLTTGIELVADDQESPADVYTLSGVLVRSQATTLEGLPKGIYIVGGRKCVVR